MAVAGGVAYVTDVPDVFLRTGARGLWAIRVSYPDALVNLGNYNIPASGEVREMVIADGKAYFAKGEQGLEIVDVSQPKDMKQLGQDSTFDIVYDLAVQDGYADVATSSGLIVCNVSDPANIQHVGQYSGAEPIHGIAVDGNRAYITGETKFEILDIINPASPALVKSFAYAGQSQIPIVSVAKETVYYPDDGSNLKILDAKSMTASAAGDTLLRGEPAELVVKDDLIFNADEDGGLMILRYQAPVSSGVKTNWFLIR